MDRLVPLLLLVLSQAVSAAELFGVPLISADKGTLGFAVQRAGGTLVQTERNQVYEVFDSQAVLDTSFKLYLGFDVQTGRFGFAEYHIRRFAHDIMLRRLTDKYGEPAVERGAFLTDQRYSWRVGGIDIAFQKNHGCMCSRLVYSESETLATTREQHRQIQRQRTDEAAEAYRNAY